MTTLRPSLVNSPLSSRLSLGVSLLALLLSSGCSKSESAEANGKDKSDAKSESDSSAVADSAAEPTAKKVVLRPHQSLSWSELKSEKLEMGLASVSDVNAWGETLFKRIDELRNAAPAAPPQKEPAEEIQAQPTNIEDIPTPQLEFARVAGGDSGFCGAMKSGPLKCWGSDEKRDIGAYIDAATTGESACGVTVSGSVKCLPSLPSTATLKDIKRIAAGGGRYCTLSTSSAVSKSSAASKSSAVTCFSATSGELIADAVPADFEALYIGVNQNFVCAANSKRQLTCFGKVENLKLPETPLEIKDLAVGDGFVCAVDSSSQLKCFGDAPAGISGELQGIGAGYKTLCGVFKDGSGKCAGAVTHAWKDSVTRFAVGATSVCASLNNGELSCVDAAGKELEVPRDETAVRRAENEAQANANQAQYAATKAAQEQSQKEKEAQAAMSRGRFEAFVKLFPEGKLPTSFHHDHKASFGDRLPRAFDPLTGENSSSYLIGERFTLGSGAVVFSLYDMPRKRGVLWSFDDRGGWKEFIINSHSASAGQGGSDANGLEFIRKADSHEAELTKDSLISTIHEGQEDVLHVPTHRDGSKPISRVSCRVDQLRFSDAFSKEGKVTRKPLPSPGDISTSTTDKGCEKWPFDGPRSER